MSDWNFMTLEEAGIQLIDCVHKTPSVQPAGFPYVAIPQMQHGELNLSEARLISANDFKEWTRKADPQDFDIVLSRRCNPGETAVVRPGMRFALGQNLVLLRADGTSVRPRFLRWMVRSAYWWAEINKFLNVGAVFDSLRCADVPKFSLPIPPLTHQDAIAALLGALDDKIELNRRMNDTLEKMARAMFMDWFMDFGPTRAKIEGRPPYHTADLWAIFPDRFDDDGQPVGWGLGSLDDLLVLQRGFDLPNDRRVPGPYVVMAASGPNGFHNEFMAPGPGVTTGRSGVLGKVFFIHEDYWPLNTSLWVKEFKASTPAYAYCLLQNLDLGSYNAGSAVPTLNRNHVSSLPLTVPSKAAISAFDDIVTPLFKRQRTNDVEAETLSDMRDVLLPKLLSGKIRLKDAEKQIEDAL